MRRRAPRRAGRRDPRPTQLAWLRGRIDPATPDGLALTAALTAAALSAWIFGGLTQDVAAHEGTARLDPGVHAFAVAHRTGWLTAIMRNATWPGSSWVLVPALALATVTLLRARPRAAARPAVAQVWAGFLGAVALYLLAKPLVHRPRPPAADLIGHASGPSYPSGHATQAIATWGMLAIVALAGRSRSPRARVGLLTAAAAVVLLVGASRIYVGAHWLTDVLAGYALGATWLALLLALRLRRRQRSTGAPQPAATTAARRAPR